MQNILNTIKNNALKEIENIKSGDEYIKLEKKYLGRNGEFTKAIKDIKSLAEKERPIIGKIANEIRIDLENGFNKIKEAVLETAGDIKGSVFSFDPTLQSKKQEIGHLHPTTLIQNELMDIFASMGFMILEGPELESDYYNFESLNVPKTHPARDMQDTYYIKPDKKLCSSQIVLRTQTSNMQVRTMHEYGAPLRAIFPGKCFRNEATDVCHDNSFHQLEGTIIDKNISVANLIAVMEEFLSKVFKRELKTKLRPAYFPFVEPGFEVDMNCIICDGAGCPSCKNSGWLEMIGCGLMHPNVLRAGGIDPEEYGGFAFGLGTTRMIMMLHEIADIRLMQSGDIRFTKQF